MRMVWYRNKQCRITAFRFTGGIKSDPASRTFDGCTRQLGMCKHQTNSLATDRIERATVRGSEITRRNLTTKMPTSNRRSIYFAGGYIKAKSIATNRRSQHLIDQIMKINKIYDYRRYKTIQILSPWTGGWKVSGQLNFRTTFCPLVEVPTSCHPSEGPCYVTAYENNANPNPNKKFMELLKFLNKCLLGLELGLFSYAMT